MLSPIKDARVRGSVRILYLGAGLVFLATIGLGVLNAITTGEIDRGQLLSHFHSGSIGWVTLSVIATMLWIFTQERAVGPREGTMAQVLAWMGVVSAAGYTVAFILAFGGQGATWMLPLFGIPMWLTILGALVFALATMRAQRVQSAPHWLMIGALVVAGLGATMGVLIGLSYSGVFEIPMPADGEMVGAHAGPMDMYLALAFAAIAETLIVAAATPARWAGKAQAIIGTLSGIGAMVALFTGIEPLIPLSLLLFLIAFLFYFIRIGWRGLKVAPTAGRNGALFFGAIGFPLYIGLFIYTVARYYSQGLEPPHGLAVAFVHITFVAMATNLLFAQHSRFTERPATGRGELISAWLLNAGLVAFLAGVMAGVRHGAYIMAAGALMGVVLLVMRTWRMTDEPHIEAAPTG